MRKMKRIAKKTVTLLSVAAIFVGTLTACGSGSNADKKDDTSSKSENIVVKAATGGAPAPYIFVDDDGNLSGYDVDVINELFSRVDGYDVEWEITEFASIFTGLDSDIYQLGVNHFGFNTERSEKYIYSDVLAIDPVAILVSKDNTDINSVYDLPGHKTEASATSYYLSVFENFNNENEDKINYEYVEDPGQTPLHVAEGQIDFEIFTKTTLQSQIDSLGLNDDVKLIDVPTKDNEWLTSGVEAPSGTFYLVAKGNEELAQKLNEAFEEAVKDGTIYELQKKYLGVTEENKLTLEQVENTKKQVEKLTSQE